ncbi:MAG: ABC transporter ATP-binding protein [Bdellovibrionales bacterium]|nr:ABC transporter ATP-binding protein [Bdellovibrionales bacterium]
MDSQSSVPAILISSLEKKYDNGLQALHPTDLSIQKGEIFALLGPNGAGKSTLINMVCGIVNPSGGEVKVQGYDIIKEYRQARSLIGLVPQELTTHSFETVNQIVEFSRSLFNCPKDHKYTEELLRSLTLWEKRDEKIIALSGGMKRRLLIAQALSHKPKVLFLDEPTAGVDVELRKNLWDIVLRLRDQGVTIVLTTHYIEEAEAMADRVGIINKGKIALVEDKNRLLEKFGHKKLILTLAKPLNRIPSSLQKYELEIEGEGTSLTHVYSSVEEDMNLNELLCDLSDEGIMYSDLQTKKSSLEEVFVQLVQS